MQKNTEEDEPSGNALHCIHVVHAYVVVRCAPIWLSRLALFGVLRLGLDPEGDDPDDAPDDLHAEEICSYGCVGADSASFLGYRPDESVKASLVQR